MMWGYGGNYGYGSAWLGMGLMMLFGLLVLVGIVLLVIWAVRAASGTGPGVHSVGTADACDIAKTRYARGEISKEEYFEICRNIGAHHS
jgi:putative membrane protein